MTKEKFFNCCENFVSMIRTELIQEQKYEKNRRCKRPNWDSIANYLSDSSVGIGVEVTGEEVKRIAHEYKWEG